MNKLNSIAWHKENLVNDKSSLDKDIEDLKIKERQVNELINYVNFYEYQIEQAIKKGKEEFDRDRFRKSKRERKK